MVYRYVKNFRNASLIQLDFWKFLKNKTQINGVNINSPFLDQKPGTSGLRKSTLKFQEEHYLEIFIEAILQSLEDLKGSTIVVGGDGRYGNIEAIEKIVQICVAHKVQKVIVPKYGLLSTPATSNLIRKENAIGNYSFCKP